MNEVMLLTELRRRGIHVWVEADQLRCNAPAGALTAEVRGELKQWKSQLVEFLCRAEALAMQPRAIVPLQPRGKRTPIFAVPGHNGDVFTYRALARRIGEDQPFFGLQPPGLDGQSEPLTSVTNLATYFRQQIRAFQPNSPYVIAGFCAGGTIAFELAQQLLEQGASVSFVALFASPYPTWYRFLPQLYDHFFHHARSLASQSNAERRTYFVETVRRFKARRDETRHSLTDRVLVMRAHVMDLTLAAVRRYKPRYFDGRLALFLPSNEWLRRDGRLARRWRPLAREIEEYCGPDGCTGDRLLHDSYTPNLAALFSRCREKTSEYPRLNFLSAESMSRT
jgi:thioesterase domain-containing protein